MDHEVLAQLYGVKSCNIGGLIVDHFKHENSPQDLYLYYVGLSFLSRLVLFLNKPFLFSWASRVHDFPWLNSCKKKTQRNASIEVDGAAIAADRKLEKMKHKEID